MRILQAIQRELRARARRRLTLHARDQCLEGGKMSASRRGSQPVVKSVLAEGALRPIDRAEHRIQIEVGPRPVVERRRRVGTRQPAAMRCGDRVHAPGAVDWFPPGRTDACETPLAREVNRGQCEQGRECGGGHGHEEHAGHRHCTKHVLSALNPWHLTVAPSANYGERLPDTHGTQRRSWQDE